MIADFAPSLFRTSPEILNGEENRLIAPGGYMAASGTDALTGGEGDHLLRGNARADTFAFGDGFGQDTVADFTDSLATHYFRSHSTVNAIASLSISTSGGDAVVSDGMGNTVLVIGATFSRPATGHPGP